MAQNSINKSNDPKTSSPTLSINQPPTSLIDRLFHLSKRNTSVKTEIIAGVTTFLSMAYILAVNPQILGSTGMNRTAIFSVTVLASIIGTLLMGLLANLPIALAPGMGLNAFFTYTVVSTWHIPWQTALAGVLAAGVLFTLLSLTKFLNEIITIIPMTLKYAISAGIGLFITFSGLQNAKIIVPDSSTGVTIGNLHNPTVVLALVGILITIILVTKKVLGGIFIGMIITAIIGIVAQIIPLPSSIVSTSPSIQPLFAQSIFHLGDINTLQMLVVMLTFFFVGIFDTAGTILGVGTQGHITNQQGSIVGSKRSLVAASLATTIGSILGTSTTTAYAESTSGVAAGGRTGLTAVTVAILFGLASFFSPLLTVITSAVTVPALVIVGILMISNVQYIQWNKFEFAVPAFATLIMMPLTYSISEGMAFGFILYPITMILSGKAKQVHPLLYILMFLFIAYFVFVL